MGKNRSILRFALVIFSMLGTGFIGYAQMRKYQAPNKSPFQAKLLSVGMVIPSSGTAPFEINGKTGFEVMYAATSKYSDRFEMMGAYTYTKAGFEYNIYEEKRIDGGFYSTYAFTPYAMPVSMHTLAINILPTYYIIPDVVGIFAGVDLGVAFFLYDYEDRADSKLIYSKKDLTPLNGGTTPAEAFPDETRSLHGQENFTVFNYGLQFGAHYTYKERLRIHIAYSMQLNNQFEDDLNTFTGGPKVQSFRVGLGYIFQPDNSIFRF